MEFEHPENETTSDERSRDIRLLRTRCPRLTGSDPHAKREEIRQYFRDTWALEEKLYECLSEDAAFYERAIPLRHPLIFYFGHTATFFINKLITAGWIDDRIQPEFESMFAVGVDEMSWDDLNEISYNWPSVSEVRRYRDQVHALVDNFISKADLQLPIRWEDPFWIVLMGAEHARIHIETSSVLIRQLPLRFVRPHPLFRECASFGEAPKNQLVEVPAFEGTLGKSREDSLYGWDNEYGEWPVRTSAFQASRYLVSNGEFLEFVNNDGYQNLEYWTDEGRRWLSFSQAKHPEFWRPDKTRATYSYRTVTRLIPMPWNWPVDVNYLEAKAFCNWKAAKTNRPIRLPTEAEWFAMRRQVQGDQPEWERAPGNINLEHWASACPVDMFGTPQGLYDVIGNVWQWSETPIHAFTGFQVHPAYDDFSAPTFDTKHNLIKGGSYFSTGNCAIRDSRYAFRRHFFQHAGFRYVDSEQKISIEDNPYESDALLSQYIEFHYGAEYFQVPNFPKMCANVCLKMMDGRTAERALDIGCGTGRSSFELARRFGHVDGLDFSARFIQVASELQMGREKRYTIATEGDLIEYKSFSLKDLELSDTAVRCRFMQADACNLPVKFADYDLVFAGNLLDRLYDPKKFLKTIHERLRPQGLLILTSPYTWLEEFTPREEWIGGRKRDGEDLSTLTELQEILSPHFRPFSAPMDIPFVVRETARKFQHTLSQLTVWEKTE